MAPAPTPAATALAGCRWVPLPSGRDRRSPSRPGTAPSCQRCLSCGGQGLAAPPPCRTVRRGVRGGAGRRSCLVGARSGCPGRRTLAPDGDPSDRPRRQLGVLPPKPLLVLIVVVDACPRRGLGAERVGGRPGALAPAGGRHRSLPPSTRLPTQAERRLGLLEHRGVARRAHGGDRAAGVVKDCPTEPRSPRTVPRPSPDGQGRQRGPDRRVCRGWTSRPTARTSTPPGVHGAGCQSGPRKSSIPYTN